jgi:CheY-like chemotaxis protein
VSVSRSSSLAAEVLDRLLPRVDSHGADLVGRDTRRLHAGPWRPADTGRSTVLYVEDNLSNLRLVRYILELRPDVDLVPAMEGRLALERAHAHRVSLILLDLQLPDISGEEVLAQLRADQRTRHIPVVVISAHATPSEIDRLLDAGVHSYLTKPFQVREFLTVVDGILCTSRQMAGRPSPQWSGREREDSSGLSTSGITAAQTTATLRSPPAGRVRR